uniref:CAZy families GH1 protein n=1 Tax=uncultured Tolumonas sp. TaxID=263765 RepID=A0A060C5P6_9GAMM|nr:CAZy families GH1 protein [uncultured Tolumonas sp.]
MLVAQSAAFGIFHTGRYPGKIGPAPNICAIYPYTHTAEDELAAMYFTAFRNWLYLDAAVYGIYNQQAMEILHFLHAEPDITLEDKKIIDGKHM